MIRRRAVFRGLVAAGIFALVAVAAVLGAAAVVDRAARGHVQTQLETLPARRVGLVLGCAPVLASGRPNAFFTHRIQAAAALLRSGRVQYLLLSGDNHRRDYDEPSEMKRALVAAGVPESRLVLDYAGFSTLDSMARARRVFGLSEVIVVSQRDHAARAVYLGHRHGLSVDALAAPNPPASYGPRNAIREALARVRAVLDVEILHRRPHFLGPPIAIGREAASGP